MHEARFRPDDLGQVREEGDDVVLDLRFDLVDAGDVERGGLALFPDFLCSVLGDDAEFGHGVGGVRLDLEPDAEFGFRRPDRGHRGAGVAGDQRRFPARQRRRAADGVDVGFVGAALENGGAGDQHVGAGGDDVGGVGGGDAAVDLDVDRAAANQRAHRGDLVELRLDEALAAEAGIDRHDQHEIDQVDDVLQRGDRRAGIERDAGLLAERADRLQRAVHVRTGLDMHGDDVGAGFGEGIQIGIARRDHQMHVEALLADRADRLHHARADRDVGHEMAVHDIDMDPVGAGGLDATDFVTQFGEVGRKNRRRDDQRAHGSSPNAVRVTRGAARGNAPREVCLSRPLFSLNPARIAGRRAAKRQSRGGQIVENLKRSAGFRCRRATGAGLAS